jgi:(p)ppGpp synthase/HD superfamily hydrolase
MLSLFRKSHAPTELPAIVQAADQFASMAHGEIDQRRKYSGAPYIVHPRAVARRVGSVADHTDDMLAAALLHDVIEDTRRTEGEIRTLFGEVVADMVMDLTDQIPLSVGNRALRKRLEAQRLAWTSAQVQTVKLADLVDNSVDILRQDRGFARVYLPEKMYLVEMMDKGDARLRDEAMATIEAGLRMLSHV